MVSVVGTIRSEVGHPTVLTGVLGPSAQIETIGHATLAVRGEESSIAASGTWVCAISGRLDNRDDLVDQQRHAGLARGSAADIAGTLIARLGPEAVGRLRGEFGGVFTDGEQLLWFRDHMGFWPVYHSISTDGVVVADSIRICTELFGDAYRVNETYLEEFFYGRIGNSTATAVAGVDRLPAGCWGRCDGRATYTTRYWDPEELVEHDPPTQRRVPEMFENLMTQAVDRVLTGTDAVLLSGGVDSPVVGAFAAPLYERRFGRALPALSAVYPDIPAVDEEELITLVANRFGMPLHTYRPHASATEDLSKWVGLLDGPVPVVSLAETRETLGVAQELGFDNLLTGEWAEFLFDMPQRTLAYLFRRGRWSAAGRYWAALRRAGLSTGAITSRLAKDLTPFQLRRKRAQQLMGSSTPPWIDRNRLVFHPRGPVTEQWRSSQAAMVSGPGLGVEADHVVQVEAGVSIRRPFADVDLVEFFLRLPAEIKYPGPGRKLLVKDLMRGRVPDRILDRTEKTLFDEAVEASIDYEVLASLLAEDELMEGVDYPSLRARISRRELNLVEYMWAKDLAAVHAFVSHAARR